MTDITSVYDMEIYLWLLHYAGIDDTEESTTTLGQSE